MERIDRKILEDLQHVTQEERKGVMKAYDILKQEPQTKLYMAILREAVMYREMAMALMMKMKQQQSHFEARLTELEESK